MLDPVGQHSEGAVPNIWTLRRRRDPCEHGCEGEAGGMRKRFHHPRAKGHKYPSILHPLLPPQTSSGNTIPPQAFTAITSSILTKCEPRHRKINPHPISDLIRQPTNDLNNAIRHSTPTPRRPLGGPGFFPSLPRRRRRRRARRQPQHQARQL